MAQSDNLSKDPVNFKNPHLTRFNDAYTIVQELSNRSQLTKFSGSQKSFKTCVQQCPPIYSTNSAEKCQQFSLCPLSNTPTTIVNPSAHLRECMVYLKNPILKNEVVEIEKRDLKLIFPSQEVTIFVGSWNMNGQLATKEIKDVVFPSRLEYVPDIVAIGTQETCESTFEWEATIQAQLGPTKVLFHSVSLGTLHLAVFIRRDLIWHCSEPEDSSISTRAGSAFRTKGAVAISFCLFGTSFLFVTSHLTAHQQNVSERIRDVKRIINLLGLPKNLNLRKRSRDVTDNFDNVYWCGDLNFRLNESRKNIFEWIRNTNFPLSTDSNHDVIQTDQLLAVLSSGDAFKGFNEAKITFPPTYKYDPGTHDFDSSYKERAPAYTDRILYKYRKQQGLKAKSNNNSNATARVNHHFITCLIYDSVPSIKSSDHKPVYAIFKSTIRPGKDTVSMAGGRFNRRIYLEGMKRRLSSEKLTVCSVQ